MALLLGAGCVAAFLSTGSIATAPIVSAAPTESVSQDDGPASRSEGADRDDPDGEPAADDPESEVGTSDAPALEGSSDDDSSSDVADRDEPPSAVGTDEPREADETPSQNGRSDRGDPSAGDEVLADGTVGVAERPRTSAVEVQGHRAEVPDATDASSTVTVDATAASDEAAPAILADSPPHSDQVMDAAPTESGTALVRVADAASQAPLRSPTLLNVIGSAVLNLLVGLIHIVDGPPVLPANSTVTVRTSSVTLPIGSGRKVQADWYFPEVVDDSTRFVYLQHGFLASGPMYSYTAADLSERTNSIVVVPSLSSNFFAVDAAWVGGSTMHRAVADLFLGDRQELTRSAAAAAGYAVTLPERFVLVGHSAGGTLVTSAAGFMADNGAIDDLVGIVMLDGVEPAGSRLLSDALAKLRNGNDRPLYLISSERYFWSRGGDMADKLQLARPDRFTGVSLTSGRHGDYITGGNPLIQFLQNVINGFSQRQNVAAAGLITAGWVNDLFAGDAETGVYGSPGESLVIDTPSGAAHVTVLPLGEPDRPVWPPLVDAVLTSIFDFGGKYLFVYEPLRGHEIRRPSSALARSA